MKPQTMGNIFEVMVAGESHGPAITAMVMGVPAGTPVQLASIQAALDRRRPGQNEFTSPRDERDRARITAGVFGGLALGPGSPIAIEIPSTDQRSQDYDDISTTPRPGHADAALDIKYGIRDYRGGGRSSFRVFAGLVAAGVIAKQVIDQEVQSLGLTAPIIRGFVDQVGWVRARVKHMPTPEQIENSPIRCPDEFQSERMEALIRDVSSRGDSIGGVVAFMIEGLPAGLGGPLFLKLPAMLSHAMMTINATTGFEIGDGFGAAMLRGSEYSDQIVGRDEVAIHTRTNHAGGTNGGISNGMPIVGRVAFHPTASISVPLHTVDGTGQPTTIVTKGRHDPCVVPRAVPAVEAMAAIVLADSLLMRRVDRI